MTATACRASSAPSSCSGRSAEAGPDGLDTLGARRALGASKSSAFAILQTLLGYGFVADSGSGMSRRYRLGLALARLGDSSSRRSRCATSRCRCCATSRATTGLTSRVAVLEEPYAVVIGRVDAPRARRPLRDEPRQAGAHALLRRRQGDARRPPRAEARGYLRQSGMPQKTRHTVTDVEEL